MCNQSIISDRPVHLNPFKFKHPYSSHILKDQYAVYVRTSHKIPKAWYTGVCQDGTVLWLHRVTNVSIIRKTSIFDCKCIYGSPTHVTQ